MSKIAVDVVLLPPEHIIDKAVGLNRKIIGIDNSIKLDKEKCLPHISLAMGAINIEDIGEIKIILGKLKKKYMPLKLKINKIYTKKLPNGKKVSGLEIEKNGEIQFLHEEVMKNVKIFFKHKVDSIDKNMLVSPNEIEGITLDIIQDYASKSSLGNFYPHITIGIGELENKKLDIEFVSTRLTMFQLGNYCTCRRRLI